jgi:hypothetical protein
MKKNIFFFVLLNLFLLSGCNKHKLFDGPNSFSENFESGTTREDLFPAGETRWSNFQLTVPTNHFEFDTTHPHSGNQCMHFYAEASPSNTVSKCSIFKHNMSFWAGQTMHVHGWFYLEGNLSEEWLFICDLEEQTAIGAGPGMRIAMVNNRLCIEHKYDEPTIYQTVGNEIDFPRDQWVEIDWEVKLSQKHRGYVKLWQNGQLIINSDKEQTLPKDILYAQQGTKGMYSSVEVGLTANSKDNATNFYVDDFDVMLK